MNERNDELCRLERGAMIPKSGIEPFHLDQNSLHFNLLDFWRWSSSDLISNATRGILAEYIVAKSLHLTDGVRSPWDSYDLLTKDKCRIEVKSAAYIQSWHQIRPSDIRFNIRPTRAWKNATNVNYEDLRRQGDIYVFCLFKEKLKEKDTANPLNLAKWEFYVLSAKVLNNKFKTQKSIGLPSLLKLSPLKLKYQELEVGIEQLASLAITDR